MAALLVFVFFACLVFAYMSEVVSAFSRKVVSILVKETGDEQNLKNQLKVLQAELKTINMVDEFSKYAKLERRINKAKEELKVYNKSRNDVYTRVKFGSNILFRFLQIIIALGLIWSYRSSSLMSIPAEWTWPLSYLVAFPSKIEGAVGITWWFIVCRSVIQKGMNIHSPSTESQEKEK